MIPYFINPHSFAIAVPNAMGSTTVVPPGGLVKGTYYTALSLIGLLADYDGVVDPLNVYYTYPEGSGSGSPSSGITDITAGTGILVDIVGTEATISLNPGAITAAYLQDGTITAAKIADGQVVKSFNTYTDKVQLNFNAGFTAVETPSLDPDVATVIDVSVDAPGLTLTNATLPLVLSLSNGNQTLNGSIEITPTNDGGAIALQTSLPVEYQSGNIGLAGTYYGYDFGVRLNSSDDLVTVVPDTYASIIGFARENVDFFAFFNKDVTAFVDNAGNLPLVSSLSLTGVFKSTGLLTYGGVSVFAEDLNELLVIDALADVATSSISLYPEVQVYGPITLNSGAALGGTVATEPLVSFSTSSTTVPAILVENSLNGNKAIALQTKNSSDDITAQLDTDGNLFISSIEVATISTPPIFLAAGAYAVENYEEKVFIFDCTSTATTVELPELTVGGQVKNGTIYTFAKYDATTNAVLIAPSNGQQINGQTDITLTEQGQSVNIMAVVQSSPLPATFWITVGRA